MREHLIVQNAPSKANRALLGEGNFDQRPRQWTLAPCRQPPLIHYITQPIFLQLFSPSRPSSFRKMGFFESFCKTLTGALGLSALSQWGEIPEQQPLSMDVAPGVRFPSDAHLPRLKVPKRPNDVIFSEDYHHSERQTEPGPIFHPPNASPGFDCDYSAMKGWRHSADAGARTQWLSHSADDDFPYGGTYDINTDWGKYAPTGITRKVGFRCTRCP